jgi:mono/diheme cytochrome c family protein
MRVLVALAAVATASVVACASAGRLPVAPGEEGAARLYRSRCAACHALYPPGEHTAGDWPAILDRMAPRAHLGADERATVERYLVAHARKG